MLPIVNSDVLAANPKFDALYRDLCMNKLNRDGTTQIDLKAQKDRGTFSEELSAARIASAKRNLIKTYLQSLAYRGHELPNELQDILLVIAAVLQSQVSREDAKLLREDVNQFKDNIKPIAKEIWKTALDDLVTLARISAPDGHSDGDDLPDRIFDLKNNITILEERLSDVRIQTTHEADAVHNLYRQAIESSIRVLEQTIHGSLARSTKAKADYLATVGEGMNRKLQLQYLQLLAQTKSPEVQDALRLKAEELEHESTTLRMTVRESEEKLAEYRGAKAMEGMAAEYAKILTETRKVQSELARLERKGR